MPTKKKLTRSQIRDRVRLEQTFVVQSDSERGIAVTLGKDMSIPYTSRKNGHGFIVFPTPTT